MTDAPRPTTTSPDTNVSRRWAALVGFLLLAFAAGLIGNLLQGADVDVRYLALERPAWAPPAAAFGTVWPVLYVLIAVAGWRLWTAADAPGRARRAALGAWGTQLVVNAIWPGVFFGLEAFGPAIAVIALLDLIVIATIGLAWRVDRVAAVLLVPYLGWIGYATALNVAIWLMN